MRTAAIRSATKSLSSDWLVHFRADMASSDASSLHSSPFAATDPTPSSPTHSARSSTSGCNSDELDRLSLSDYDLLPDRHDGDSHSDRASQPESLEDECDPTASATVPSGMGESSFLLPNPATFSAFSHATHEGSGPGYLAASSTSLSEAAATNISEDDTPQASTARLGAPHMEASESRRSSSSSTDALSLTFPDPESSERDAKPIRYRSDSKDSDRTEDSSDDVTSSSLDSRGSYLAEDRLISMDFYTSVSSGGRMLATPSPGPSRPMTPTKSEMIDVGVQSDDHGRLYGLSDNTDERRTYHELAARLAVSPRRAARDDVFRLLARPLLFFFVSAFVTVGSGLFREWLWSAPLVSKNVSLPVVTSAVSATPSPRFSSAAIVQPERQTSRCGAGACQLAVPYVRMTVANESSVASATSLSSCGWHPVSTAANSPPVEDPERSPEVLAQVRHSHHSLWSTSELTQPQTSRAETAFQAPAVEQAVDEARLAFDAVSTFVYDFLEGTLIPLAAEVYRTIEGHLSEYGRLARSLAGTVDTDVILEKASNVAQEGLRANRCAQAGFHLVWQRKHHLAGTWCRSALGGSAPDWCTSAHHVDQASPTIPSECAGLFGIDQPKPSAQSDPVDFWQRFGIFV